MNAVDDEPKWVGEIRQPVSVSEMASIECAQAAIVTSKVMKNNKTQSEVIFAVLRPKPTWLERR